MTYAQRKRDFNREHIWIVELDLDFCVNTYGQAPCTAQVGTTGEQKCFNTASTCQDRANYNKTAKTYRFCTNVAPLPIGIKAIPSIRGNPSIAGAIADLGGGLGIRGSVSVNFVDHPDNDIGIDLYRSERSYDPYKTGTFWTKLRERNPFYVGRIMRVYSGYLVNGEFDLENFQSRTYVIEKITVNRGNAQVVGKDVLKLADDDRAKWPRATTGELSDDLPTDGTTFTLQPSGVGDEQYPTSGWIRFNREVIAYTRVGDVFTVTERGAVNTAIQEHSAGDTGQNSIRMNDRVDKLLIELLEQAAGVDPVFIPANEWAREAENYMRVFLDAFLTEPVGASKLIKELGENAPHYLYFDERRQLIIFSVLKEPPINTDPLTADDNFMADSVRVEEKPELRLSNITINFGQFDPTQRLEEFGNYSQRYTRLDLAAESDDEYGQEKIRVINSRWINNFNKAQAATVAALIGRRYGKTLREMSFVLAPKDSDLWVGNSFGAFHPLFVSPTGEQISTPFEVQSVQQSGDMYQYSALEYLYSDRLPDDPETGVDLVQLGGNANNINIREIHRDQYGEPTDETIVRVQIDANVLIGSVNKGLYSIDTGTWPAGMESIKFVIRGIAAGRGGIGGLTIGGDGGPCLILNHDVTIEDITGWLGGGGGGGGAVEDTVNNRQSGGGGGAGVEPGTGTAGGQNGTPLLGGLGRRQSYSGGFANGGNGGDLGQDGTQGSASNQLLYEAGKAGAAINTNGYNLVVLNGNERILGAIL